MDLISRQAAIEAVHKTIYGFFDIVDDDSGEPFTKEEERFLAINKAISTRIKSLPSAQPERKKGKWIQKSKPLDFCTEWWYECSECGSKPPNDRYGHHNYLTDYCPNCGSYNGGGDDEVD